MDLWKRYGNSLRADGGTGPPRRRLRGCSKPRSACIGIAALAEQLRLVAEGDERSADEPERVA